MTWWRRLFGGRTFERQLDAEMQDHLDRLVAEYQSAGLSPADARRRALLEFGPVESIKDGCRDVRPTRWLEDGLADVLHACRVLRKSPAFTCVAVGSLALGIGANVTVAALVDVVLIRPLPVRAPHELVLLAERWSEREAISWSLPAFRALAGSDALAGLCAFRPQVSFVLEDAGGAEIVPGQLVSSNCDDILGTTAALGRTLTPDDDRTGTAAPVAVISDGLWRRRFGADPGAIGRSLVVRGHAFTIVGVMPRGFHGLEPGRTVDVTVPLSLQPLVFPGPMMAMPSARWLRLIGRLPAGVPRERAAADLERRLLDLPPPAPNMTRGRVELRSGAQGLNELAQRFSEPLRILMAAVALLLVVACANLAGLVQSRARTREDEIALRLALGASRGRVVRQLLTESLVIATLGGMTGVALAFWATQALVVVLSRGRSPITIAPPIDWGVLAVAGALTVAAGLLAGSWPALRATRGAGRFTLRTASRATAASGRRASFVLIAAQTTLSVVLLTGTVLFARTLQHLYALDMGFDRRDVVLIGVRPAPGQSSPRFYEALHARVSEAPGVRTTSLTMDTPLGGTWYTASVSPVAGATGDEQVAYNFVGPRFFEAFGIPLVAGRDIRGDDTSGARPIAVVSESLARRYFPDRSAIGERLVAGQDVVEIVGVAKDVPYQGLRLPKERVLYRPYLQTSGDRIGVTLVLRTGLPPAAAADLVRRAVRELSPTSPIASVTTLAAQVDGTIASERLLADISVFFGTMALLLVGIGVYGTLASTLAQRAREMGIRVALGASRRRIATAIVRSAVAPVCAGLAIGAPLAGWTTTVARGLLFGVSARDPLSYGVVVGLLLTAAVLAAALPARRAMRADPVTALREA